MFPRGWCFIYTTWCNYLVDNITCKYLGQRVNTWTSLFETGQGKIVNTAQCFMPHCCRHFFTLFIDISHSTLYKVDSWCRLKRLGIKTVGVHFSVWAFSSNTAYLGKQKVRKQQSYIHMYVDHLDGCNNALCCMIRVKNSPYHYATAGSSPTFSCSCSSLAQLPQDSCDWFGARDRRISALEKPCIVCSEVCCSLSNRIV